MALAEPRPPGSSLVSPGSPGSSLALPLLNLPFPGSPGSSLALLNPYGLFSNQRGNTPHNQQLKPVSVHIQLQIIQDLSALDGPFGYLPPRWVKIQRVFSLGLCQKSRTESGGSRERKRSQAGAWRSQEKSQAGAWRSRDFLPWCIHILLNYGAAPGPFFWGAYKFGLYWVIFNICLRIPIMPFVPDESIPVFPLPYPSLSKT
jgi:hypothetical protein